MDSGGHCFSAFCPGRWVLLFFVLMHALPCAATEGQNGLAKLIAQRTYTDDLPGIEKRKRIRALVVYSPTDFFFAKSGTPMGLQVDLLNEYEKHLNRGVKRATDRTRVQFIPTTSERLIPDLVAGKGDIAAALLTLTPERESQVDFITGKRQKVRELVVTHRSVDDIESVEDLARREVFVAKGSSHAEHLRQLNRELEERGVHSIEVREGGAYLSSEDMLELVNSGAVKVTVADDYRARLWAEVLPDIRVLDSVPVKSGASIGWAVRKGNPELKKSLNLFLQEVKRGTLLGNMLFNRYYKRTKWIRNPNAREEREKLLELLGLFRKYGDRYGFDGLAIAAQGYQESGLDQSRRSHRGAVGIMQLLPSTAADKSVGIPDISKAEENIHAGVRYMAFIRDRYFTDPEISEEDRMAFSWAAYNAGPAKVRKMRSQAGEMGLNPNVWHANVELAAGKVTGRETVEYVNNIFKYYLSYSLVRDQHRESGHTGKKWHGLPTARPLVEPKRNPSESTKASASSR